MLPANIIKKVRGIELRTKRLVNDVFGGEYHSVFKGRGIEFAEVREYGFGDDVRFIDWNVTARMDRPFIKTFEEERELTVILAVDASGSGRFGTRSMLKEELAAEVFAVLAFSAIKNNDRVGLVMFTGDVELTIPPEKGKKHVLRVIRELLYFKPTGKRTDIARALQHINRVVKRKAIVFLISDFIDHGFEQAMSITGHKHDLIAVSIGDEREEHLSDSGVIAFEDAETGRMMMVDTSSRAVRKRYWQLMADRRSALARMFSKNGIDHIALMTGQPYEQSLIRFFKQRMRHFR